MQKLLLALTLTLFVGCASSKQQIQEAAVFVSEQSAAIESDQNEIVANSEKIVEHAGELEVAAQELHRINAISQAVFRILESVQTTIEGEAADRVAEAVILSKDTARRLESVTPLIKKRAQDSKTRATITINRVQKTRESAQAIINNTNTVRDVGGGWGIWSTIRWFISYGIPILLAMVAFVLLYPLAGPVMTVLQSFGLGLSKALKSIATDLWAHKGEPEADERIEVLEKTVQGKAALRYAKRRARKREPEPSPESPEANPPDG